jgi:hypothetical protein
MKFRRDLGMVGPRTKALKKLRRKDVVFPSHVKEGEGKHHQKKNEMTYMGKGGAIAMIVIGAILLVSGIGVLAFWGMASGAVAAEVALGLSSCSAYYTGSLSPYLSTCVSSVNAAAELANAAAAIFMYPGIIMLAIGAILLIFGIIKIRKA